MHPEHLAKPVPPCPLNPSCPVSFNESLGNTSYFASDTKGKTTWLLWSRIQRCEREPTPLTRGRLSLAQSPRINSAPRGQNKGEVNSARDLRRRLRELGCKMEGWDCVIGVHISVTGPKQDRHFTTKFYSHLTWDRVSQKQFYSLITSEVWILQT